MENEIPCGCNLVTEKLLCMIVLADDYAHMITDNAGDAFFRAFLVKHRETGEVTMRYRFRYKNRDSWYHTTDSKLSEDPVELFTKAIHSVITTAVKKFADIDLPENALIDFMPPDDNGDGNNSVKWLIEKDLMSAEYVM